eukprot:UN24489
MRQCVDLEVTITQPSYSYEITDCDTICTATIRQVGLAHDLATNVQPAIINENLYIYEVIDDGFRKMVATTDGRNVIQVGYVNDSSTTWTDLDTWTLNGLYYIENLQCGNVGSKGTYVLHGGTTTEYIGKTSFTFPSTTFTIFVHGYFPEPQNHAFMISFATSTSTNCLLVRADFEQGWHYIRVVVDGSSWDVYQDNVLHNQAKSNNDFCGMTTGYLVFGQDQDSFGGSFDANQNPSMKFDYVYVANGMYTTDNCFGNPSQYHAKWDFTYPNWRNDNSGNNNDLDLLSGGSWESNVDEVDCGGSMILSMTSPTNLSSSSTNISSIYLYMGGFLVFGLL